MEHAINQFSILLTKSMDKELQQAVKQESGEYSQDGVLIWHIIFHLIFDSKNILVQTLISTLGTAILTGFSDIGLNYINNIRELLRFSVGVDFVNGVVDDKESMFHLL